MMERDGFDNRYGQTPQSKQVPSNLRMAATENFNLSLTLNDAGFGDERLRTRVLAGEIGGQNKLAHVVQKTGDKARIGEGLSGAFISGDRLGASRHFHRVRPNVLDNWGGRTCRSKLAERTDRQHE